jgi:hypothetical protein
MKDSMEIFISGRFLKARKKDWSIYAARLYYHTRGKTT